MRGTNKLIMTLAIACCFCLSARAQVDTIRLQDKRLATSVLKPGLNQYLVYFQGVKDKKTMRFWFWLRDIKIEDRNGEKVFAITQHWFGNDTMSYRYVYSVNKLADFAPIYHKEIVKGLARAYNWTGDKIAGADSVADNTTKDFSLDFKLPNFNWNLDIETFEMLPLAKGKTFAINFYDAGLEPPQYVKYQVTGSEVIATLDGQKADCWKLFTEADHNGKYYSETYWISKKNHEFLKEEDSYPGGYRYKVKMLASATDLMQRF